MNTLNESVRIHMGEDLYFACGQGIVNRFTNYLHTHCVIKAKTVDSAMIVRRNPTMEEIEQFCPKFKRK